MTLSVEQAQYSLYLLAGRGNAYLHEVRLHVGCMLHVATGVSTSSSFDRHSTQALFFDVQVEPLSLIHI